MLHGLSLREIGQRAHVYDADGDNLGFATLPRPVEAGDVFALETGPPLRVAAVLVLSRRMPSTALIEAQPARLPITG